MAIDKVYPDRASAIADIVDGSTIMTGGWGGWVGLPVGLIRALKKKGSRNLHLIATNSGGQVKDPSGEWADSACLAEGRQLRKVTVCWTKPAGFPVDPVSPAARQILEGTLEVELVPLGTLVDRIRAGGAGIGGFFTPVGVGTVVEKGKEKKVINGREYILELPLTADFGLIRALKADCMGNLVYHGVGRSMNTVVAAASKVTIVEAEEIVQSGDLEPESIHTPGIYVHRSVKIAKEEVLWRRRNPV